jgi:predicted amidohydrolase
MVHPNAFEILTSESTEETCPPGHVRLAAVQMDLHIAEASRNVAACAEAMELSRRRGATLIAFPECVLTGYCFSGAEEAREAALERDGPELRELARAAGELGVAAVVGYMERTGNGLANSVSIVDGEGIRGHYQKTHLPHLGGDRYVVPGENRFQVYEVLGLSVGLLVCYDASFPEAARLLTFEGADLVLLPTNWPEEAEIKAEWLPNARAYENVIYFASINRVGTERGFAFHGISRICDPTGATLVQGPRDRAAILIADIDPRRARNKRIERREGYWVDRIGQRREDLYRLIPEPPVAKE